MGRPCSSPNITQGPRRGERIVRGESELPRPGRRATWPEATGAYTGLQGARGPHEG
ncbi:hypothetical protein BO71DRAFT_400077 [Aspergillus ellipticus CBS 707.79]|uniref:Uncharacterized protein n=1 Tax=Aspergillus ellipticus CBS 707.79 TaxID=1448320 RepID=A0A319D6T0_9EURO|nr:hypothetical protein BO71DRAFT_400077 [Aspergillus ellipticus CBS 707.79]